MFTSAQDEPALLFVLLLKDFCGRVAINRPGRVDDSSIHSNRNRRTLATVIGCDKILLLFFLLPNFTFRHSRLILCEGVSFKTTAASFFRETALELKLFSTQNH